MSTLCIAAWPGTSRARLARAEGIETPAPASLAPPPLSATPLAAPAASSARTSTTLLATCCQLAADYKKRSAGSRRGRVHRASTLLRAAQGRADPGEKLGGA